MEQLREPIRNLDVPSRTLMVRSPPPAWMDALRATLATAASAAMIAALRRELAEKRAARPITELGLQAKTVEASVCGAARAAAATSGSGGRRSYVEQLEVRLDEVLADITGSGGADSASCLLKRGYLILRHRDRHPGPHDPSMCPYA